MKLIFFLSCLLSPFCAGQEIRFFKEDITFHITTSSFYVDGYYWFANMEHVTVEKLIFYPFGNTTQQETIDSVKIFNITTGLSEIPSNKTDAGIYFLLRIPAGDTSTYHITYCQKIVFDSVRYILKSTQEWKQPLESAEYKLIENKPIITTHFSIPPDKIYSIQKDENIYFWKRDNFMPKEDLIFHFKRD